jgi:hypothetical protein
MGARARDARAPVGEQRVISHDAAGLQLGAAAWEEQVRAEEAPRGLEWQHAVWAF